MRNKKSMVLILVVVLTFAVAALAVAAGEKCPLCGMKMEGNANTLYSITTNDGKTENYCCAHCGLWEHNAKKDTVKSAAAANFISGEMMDATKMFYLANSSAVPACSPSWIAFGSKEDAEKFQKGFGGTIYTFDEAMKERAKQPKEMDMKK